MPFTGVNPKQLADHPVLATAPTAAGAAAPGNRMTGGGSNVTTKGRLSNVVNRTRANATMNGLCAPSDNAQERLTLQSAALVAVWLLCGCYAIAMLVCWLDAGRMFAYWEGCVSGVGLLPCW